MPCATLPAARRLRTRPTRTTHRPCDAEADCEGDSEGDCNCNGGWDGDPTVTATVTRETGSRVKDWAWRIAFGAAVGARLDGASPPRGARPHLREPPGGQIARL